ncbi:thioredoxin [Streptomyces sp. 2132.2]|uniref:Thioredoxin n=1 Tax=Streptomyces vinaceus TaxID=1960 RepID=A0A5J6J9G9_STRVI|nr:MULTISPECIES: thioredoxin [Streptomyces]QEV45424.1 thioredoxin [Streptomyces vinaceus]ROQ95706.1 thioredoxin [Streptomyces sp. 2132.2]GHE30678.1 thioredoxin [Streptomyces vinaceus]
MIHAQGVAEVTDQDFEAQVLAERGRPVLVEFTADWCGPCRQIAPVISAVAAEEAERLKVVQIDADRNPATVARYGVLSMPTLLVFQGGEPVKQMVGARAKRKLLQELEEVTGAVRPTTVTA